MSGAFLFLEAVVDADRIQIGIRFDTQRVEAIALPFAAQRDIAGQRVLRPQSQLQSVAAVVAGREAGADDYIVKPIVVKELAARIRAVRRREAPAKSDESASDVLVLSPGPEGLTFSVTGGWLRRGGDEVPLTAMEFRLLVELPEGLLLSFRVE